MISSHLSSVEPKIISLFVLHAGESRVAVILKLMVMESEMTLMLTDLKHHHTLLLSLWHIEAMNNMKVQLMSS
jgi:hypothetical protein